MLRKYKNEGKRDYEIGLLHGVSKSYVRSMRQEYDIDCPTIFDGKVLTEQRRAAIIADYCKGMPVAEISVKHGFSPTAWSTFKAHFIPKGTKRAPKKTNTTTNYSRTELLRLQELFKTDAAIGKVLGISRQRVHQIRIILGIPPLNKKDKTGTK